MPKESMESSRSDILKVEKSVIAVSPSLELEEKIAKLEEKIQEEIQTVINEITNIRTEMSKRIDIQSLSSKFDSLKVVVDEILSKRVETDLKIQTLEKILAEVQRKKEIPNLDEIKNMREEWLMISGRIDSIEEVIKEISEMVQKLKAGLDKFETLEKISLLSKEIEEKTERFKFIEEEMRRLSSRIETIYDSIDKRLDKMRDLGERLQELTETVSKLSREIDKNKIEILDKTKEEISERVVSIEKIKSTLEKKIAESLENRLKRINVDEINRILTDITMKIAMIGKKVEKLEISQAKQKEEVSIQQFRNPLEDINLRINKLDENLKEMTKKIESLKTMRELQPSIDQQIGELVNKIIFLESRLLGIERTIQETSRALVPIIIE